MADMYFEDFKVGDKFHIPSKTMTDAHFLFFLGLTADNHPIHYDEEYSKKTIFGRRVAHGLLVTCMTALGASNLSPLIENSIIAFLEQSSRFLKPVFIGDTLTPELEVAELIPKADKGIVKIKSSIRNQRGEVVLEGMQTYMLKRRP